MSISAAVAGKTRTQGERQNMKITMLPMRRERVGNWCIIIIYYGINRGMVYKFVPMQYLKTG